MTMLVDIRAPRAEVRIACTLRRTVGTPISAHTLDIGPRGMRIRTPRPLSPDETVVFDIADLDMRVNGQARVLCAERANVYALRFEGLPESMARRLHALAVSKR